MTNLNPEIQRPSEVCAKRGGLWLSELDLQSHFASALRIQNVGVLLGAGASSGPLGGQLVGQLWSNFTATFAESHQWLVNNGFVDSDDHVPNIEVLSDQLEVARQEWTRTSAAELNLLESCQANLKRCVVQAAVLQPEWWENRAMPADFPNELSAHRMLLQKLTAARQPGQPSPWIFTTNYDLAIEWAAESLGLIISNGFSGLHDRVFSPHNFDLGITNTHAKGEARFGTYSIYLAKLHGSLTWKIDGDGNIREESSSSSRQEMLDFLAGQSDTFGDEMVFPSAAKYLQTVGFVCGELFRRLTEFVARPQTLLAVSGMSFSDDHLNRLLAAALQNPTLQLITYCPELSRTGNDFDTSTASPWLKKLVRLESPQVTIVGGGSRAYFDRLSADMPDPAIYDNRTQEFRKLLKELQHESPPAYANGDDNAP